MISKSTLALFFCLCLMANLLQAQQDTSWFKRSLSTIFSESGSPEKARLLMYPTLAYAPETSLEIGISSVAFFYAKNDVEKSRLSEVQLFSFFTLRKQYGLWLDHAIYGYEDKWFFLGKTRLQRFPLLYYGIGPESPKENPSVVQADYQLARERILKKVSPDFFVGLELDYQRLYRAEFENPPADLPIGHEGSRNVGLGLGLVYDNRHNVLNERDGFFAELAWLNYHPGWGSDYRFQGLFFESRIFVPVDAKKQQVFAAHAVGIFLQGDEIPFNQLALLGGDQIMRGYYTGRFRDRQYMAVQAEYRFLPFPFHKRLGGTVFMAGGLVGPGWDQLQLSQLRPAGGLGLRYLIFPKKDIFIRVDLGITPEGTGLYIYTGEAF